MGKIRCSNCGKLVEGVCSDCWRCKDCCSCKRGFKRTIDGKIENIKKTKGTPS